MRKRSCSKQQTLYLDRLDQLSGAKQMLITRIARFEEDISGRLAQIRALEAQRSINQEELRNLRGLLADNLTQRDKVVAKELSLSETDFQIAQQRSAIGQLNVQIEEAKAESLQLDRDRRREISEEIAKTQNAILEIEEELLGLRDVVSRTQITAPQKGRVLNLSFATVGGVIPPSEPIMQIVPDGDELVVEAQLRTIDRDSISKGAEVNASIHGFPDPVDAGAHRSGRQHFRRRGHRPEFRHAVLQSARDLHARGICAAERGAGRAGAHG